jgi:hypothetical protein
LTDVTIAAYIEFGCVEDVKYAPDQAFCVARQQDFGSSSWHRSGSDVNHRTILDFRF